jgi:hypothetical protein
LLKRMNNLSVRSERLLTRAKRKPQRNPDVKFIGPIGPPACHVMNCHRATLLICCSFSSLKSWPWRIPFVNIVYLSKLNLPVASSKMGLLSSRSTGISEFGAADSFRHENSFVKNH